MDVHYAAIDKLLTPLFMKNYHVNNIVASCVCCELHLSYEHFKGSLARAH